jgi:protein gp37
MADGSAIEWTEATWNPSTGCVTGSQLAATTAMPWPPPNG